MPQGPGSSEVEEIKKKVNASHPPQDLAERILTRAGRLDQSTAYSDSEQFIEYVDWITSLPWEKKTQDILDLAHAKKTLDSQHYGLQEIKDRVLEYIAVMKLQREQIKIEQEMRSPILCFVGLVGTGKTTIAVAIAKALGRKFIRIPFGGLGDSGMLRGVARFHPGGEPGSIMKALRRAQVKNPLILLDEVDRVSENVRASVMGVLVELLDPEQNHAYADAYIDYPFDLSDVLFIATANNTGNIATAVLDRLEVIQMPSYSDEEKTAIGRDFVFPRTLRESGIDPSKVEISATVWPMIVRPLGYDAGMRTLERTIQGIVRKVARMIAEGKAATFKLDETNIKGYLPTW